MSLLPQSKIEECRESWAKFAQEHGWYIEPFFVQIWVDNQGRVLDSLSYIGLMAGIIIDADEEDD